MFLQLLWLAALMSLMVVTHTLWSLHILRLIPGRITDTVRLVMMLVRICVSMLMIHFIEATFFALFYYWRSGFSDVTTAVYFSLASYATVGYGDVVLPTHLRIIGAAEGLVGSLLAGWTVALLSRVLGTLRPGSK
ncbi:two pore domain potassium channel family protein [Lelliottia amnigena]|jgi:voltage-gated potassium channel Kch|uniref:ion channel n=1 Tax=Lelliottia TaxID=1330545 RepID=UPI00192C74E8|nr:MULTISPECIES: ion channel [Lelliottia]MBL5884915.1 two pore domain potassium channel family protein [Lelliottia aquatilis]MBL5920674.1 two pore domain potassium channel family protein [Lelliottia amnigena]MBL5932747.1 two pore domain potassium channel family protein [Lelliottia amnigena]